MPELPEIETIRCEIENHILNKTITKIIVRQSKLRWPIPRNLSHELKGQKFHFIKRRGKYLLLATDNGTVLFHLGMSGSLQVLNKNHRVKKHDHVEIIFSTDECLCFNDPRRFGCLLWIKKDPDKHKLLANLGPEPLSLDFDADYLYNRAKNRKIAIKTFIMNSHIVVGIGNIYANEILFLASIKPQKPAGSISKKGYNVLVECIKLILNAAIKKSGTTFKDFIRSNGESGKYLSELKVYGRARQPCIKCKAKLREIRLNGRSTVYCPYCQH